MRTIVLTACFLIALSSAVAGEVPSTYGAGVDEGSTVAIAELLANPDRYVDQVVRVEGEVADVCPMAGCWIMVADDGGREIRIKVKDGEIVFPKELKGHGTVAQGTFRRYELTREQAIAQAAHMAEERGLPFDPETAEVSTTMYQIEGTGAVLR